MSKLFQTVCLAVMTISQVYADDDLLAELDLLIEQSKVELAQKNNAKTSNYSSQQSQVQAVAIQKPNKQSQIKDYYAFPDKDHPVYVAVDYLFWTVSQPGLYYASTKSQPIPGETPIIYPYGDGSVSYQLGKIQKQTFGWSSGVRGTLGYQFKNTGWNLNAEYTYFNISHSDEVYRPETNYGYLTGMGSYQHTLVLAGASKSEISLNYQNAKLLLGTPWKNFSLGSLQLLFGAHSTWIDQTWHVDFYPVPAPQVSSSSSYNLWKNSTWGVGFNTTGKFDAKLGSGFSLGVTGFVAALIGQQSLSAKNYTIPFPQGVTDLQFDIYQDPTYQFMAQLMISPQIAWSRSFNSVSLRIETAYEFNALLNMLDLYRCGETADFLSQKMPTLQSTSLYLHGLTLRFGLGF